MADDYRNPADVSKPNFRSNDWYEPPVQEGWTCQKGTVCPPLVTSDQVYGHDTWDHDTEQVVPVDPYLALYYDDPDDPDIVPPEISVSLEGEQDGNDAYIATVTVTITASDPVSGIKSIEYKLNDGEWTEYTEPLEITEVAEHTLGYRATDNADNVAESSVTFEVVAGD